MLARMVLMRAVHIYMSRSGGTGRRPGLKIPWVVIPVPVRFRSAALLKAPIFGAFFVLCDNPCCILIRNDKAAGVAAFLKEREAIFKTPMLALGSLTI